MKIAFFNTKRYEKQAFEEANRSANHELVWIDLPLRAGTAPLAHGCQAACVFVNDEADAIAADEPLRVRITELAQAVGCQQARAGERDAQARGEDEVRATGQGEVTLSVQQAPAGQVGRHQRQALFERIHASGAQIVTVAMGSPKQEIFMRDCRKTHPDALYMGVGGTYDVFTGHVKRAPKIWQNLGLEWLYRLLSQPSRITRQLRLLRYLRWHYTGNL